MKNTQVCIKDTLSRTLPAVSPENFPKILEENVGNFCPYCGKTIFSNLLEIDGKVYLEKNCCTKELVFIENNVEFFKKYKNNREVRPFVSNPKSYQEWAYQNPNFGVSTVYLPITYRCNMNCPICFLKFTNSLNCGIEMPIEEIKTKLAKYNSKIIIISGGEPTVRKDLFKIIKLIKESDNVPTLLTNGLKLANKNYVEKLKRAGLKNIVLQFDGFNSAVSIRFRGKNYLQKKLKALKNIKEIGGLQVELMTVIEKKINESEISKIIQFGLKNEFIHRVDFIGLRTPKDENSTTWADLIKIMEKRGFFDQEYFLEMIKMYRNIYELTRKTFEGTPLGDWTFKRIPGGFNHVHFKKKSLPFQLLFQKKEIEKINEILTKATNKENRVASSCIIFKNSSELLKSPLFTLLKEKSFGSKKSAPGKQLLEVGFFEVGSPPRYFLKMPKSITGEFSDLMLKASYGSLFFATAA